MAKIIKLYRSASHTMLVLLHMITCIHAKWFPFLQEAAKMIKETMDKKFGAPWHAVKNLFFAGNMAVCVCGSVPENSRVTVCVCLIQCKISCY